MSRGRVFTEIVDGKIIRIFRSAKLAYQSEAFKEDRIKEVPRGYAVKEIRDQVFERAVGRCEFCGIRPPAELHEKTFRSQGGEISLENSVAICKTCHRGAEGAHPGPQWSKQ